jgi:predicted DNA-binding transcriptional regulator YafY
MVLLLGVKQIIDNSRDVSIAKIVENKLLVLIDDSYMIDDLEKYNIFKNQLKVSLKNNNAVEIDYVNSILGASSKRVIQVTNLYNSEGNDYFDAIDSKSGKVKTFRIDRIVTLKELNQELIKTTPVESDSNSFKVKIITKPWFTSRIANLGLKYQIIDHQLIIEMEFYDEEFLLDLLLRLDTDAKIESSEKVKKETLKILDERIKRMK